ncbi:tetratricopeptide repeat protein [Christiangramia salexigens]|uniref:Tetratricopeptide repeat protein n=1 Tax=Christiangramia salexigens TaxID=1913577 RepID=A0A1L3J440_9FLAO|nr:hypothetical protein [Christiangramia salexigens]APG59898.1 hypothetical protein LPB144_05485 [Christiangramia salexigens]
MKKYLLLLSLLIPSLLISQEIDSEIQKLSNKIVPEFCGCLQEYDVLQFDDKFGNCFALNLQKYENEMSPFFSNDTTKAGQDQNDKFIKDLLMGMQAKLFSECPEYFQFVKNLKDNAIGKLRSTDTKARLDSLNSIADSEKDHRYRYMKASMLFANKDYEKAQNEIYNGLALKEDKESFKVLLAWIHEEQNNPAKAVKIYDELFQETGKIELMLFREFNESKLKGRKKSNRTCSQFRTGKFKMGGTDDRRLVFVERTEDVQIETCPEDDSVTKMEIEWIDDCNYVLKYIESSESYMDEYIGKELNVKILETTGNSMKFKATMEGVDYVMIDEMQKVE